MIEKYFNGSGKNSCDIGEINGKSQDSKKFGHYKCNL